MGETKYHTGPQCPPQGRAGVEGGSGGKAWLHPHPRPSAREQLHWQDLRAPNWRRADGTGDPNQGHPGCGSASEPLEDFHQTAEKGPHSIQVRAGRATPRSQGRVWNVLWGTAMRGDPAQRSHRAH